MNDPLTVALVAGGFFLIFRLALGGTLWRRDGRHNLWMPSRDRVYVPGALIAVLATWSMAGVILGTEYYEFVYVCVVIAALLYPARPDLVGAGLGAVGIFGVVVDRLQENCLAYTTEDRVAFWAGGVVIVVVLAALRLVLSPVRAAVSVAKVPLSLAKSIGSPGRSGRFGAVALSTFGALELLDLATRQGMVQIPLDLTGATVGALSLLAAALGVLAVGLTILPNFTLSVLGIGVFVVTIAVDTMDQACADTDWASRIVILIGFFIVNRLVIWLLGR